MKKHTVQKNKLQRVSAIIVALLCIKATTQAQNLGVNTLNPDASAILDITHTSRGLLIPRLPLTSTTDVSTITSPALSLLVFNTATAGISPNDVKPGYYYWDGAKWVGIGGDSWRLTGNAGTTAGTNFVGTIDNQDLVFKTNSIENMRILNTNGNVGIGTTMPLSQLHIDGGAANSLLNVGTAGQRQLIMGNRNSTAALLNGGLGAYSSIMAANGEMRFGLTEQVNPLAIQYATFMTIQNNGNVGIGTTTPALKLHLHDAAQNFHALRFTSGVSQVNYWDLVKRGDAYGVGQNHNFVFSYNGAEHISIAPTTGNMGLGVSAPTQKLDVGGSIKITDGSEGYNNVLTSDATGKATWKDPAATGFDLVSSFTGPITNVTTTNGNTITLEKGVYYVQPYNLITGITYSAVYYAQINAIALTGTVSTGFINRDFSAFAPATEYYTMPGFIVKVTSATADVALHLFHASGGTFSIPAGNGLSAYFTKIN